MNKTKEELQARKLEIRQETQKIDAELNRLHFEAIYKIWGDKLQVTESQVKDMIANKEINPYLGGPDTSAYMSILTYVAEQIFDCRLYVKDVMHVLNNCLPIIEGYHSSVDPNKK